ncbi:unnamed protein product [Mytilus edulis]|uniref:MAM domain-containing protein n=1 Tax=Mytilus edulis TaxID=6550 RepID=A0A8S3U6R4_MYTED|nr:unnamed protein product [Mytilus edulis]
MYGTDIGTLSVYTESNNTTQMHWSQSGNQGKSWQFASFDISKSEPFRIVFEGIRGDDVRSDISLDDILLLQRSCSGSINYSQQCHHMDAFITLAECSNYYLQLDKTSLVFNPYYDDCSSNYQEIKTSIINQCDNLDSSKICSFNLSDVIKKERKCFQSNRLLISIDVEIKIFIKCVLSAEETTTVSSRITSKDDSNAGLIVGLVIGGLVLTCAANICKWIKRKMRDTNSENDYIGCQNIALPQTADHTSHMQYAGLYGHINSIKTDKTPKSTWLSIHMQLMNLEISKSSSASECNSSDKQTSNDEEYAFSDPTAETSSKASTDDRSRLAELKDTDFNRTICSNSFTGYECAHVVTGNKIGDDDQYAISNEGFYDHSGNNRNKEPENSIYDHAVDTVYDSGSHNRNNERREDTYDHFFGEQTEDDYDVSIPT